MTEKLESEPSDRDDEKEHVREQHNEMKIMQQRSSSFHTRSDYGPWCKYDNVQAKANHRRTESNGSVRRRRWWYLVLL